MCSPIKRPYNRWLRETLTAGTNPWFLQLNFFACDTYNGVMNACLRHIAVVSVIAVMLPTSGWCCTVRPPVCSSHPQGDSRPPCCHESSRPASHNRAPHRSNGPCNSKHACGCQWQRALTEKPSLRLPDPGHSGIFSLEGTYSAAAVCSTHRVEEIFWIPQLSGHRLHVLKCVWRC